MGQLFLNLAHLLSVRLCESLDLCVGHCFKLIHSCSKLSHLAALFQRLSVAIIRFLLKLLNPLVQLCDFTALIERLREPHALNFSHLISLFLQLSDSLFLRPLVSLYLLELSFQVNHSLGKCFNLLIFLVNN